MATQSKIISDCIRSGTLNIAISHRNRHGRGAARWRFRRLQDYCGDVSLQKKLAELQESVLRREEDELGGAMLPAGRFGCIDGRALHAIDDLALAWRGERRRNRLAIYAHAARGRGAVVRRGVRCRTARMRGGSYAGHPGANPHRGEKQESDAENRQRDVEFGSYSHILANHIARGGPRAKFR